MNIPVYKAQLTSPDDGIFAISLVEEPAVEVNFLAFSKDEKPDYKFEVVNEKEHCLLGVVMLADTPIYRYSPECGEYYIVFEKETIKKMAQRMLETHSFNTIDIQHNEVYFYDKCTLRELFIKDVSKGISPSGFEDVPDGSLFAVYKVDSMELWEKIEKGEVKGFSLEGFFDTEQVMNKQTKNKSKMSKIKNFLKSLLQQFGSVETVDGTEITYDGDTLEVGIDVLETADGTYTIKTDEGEATLVIEDGKVKEISPVEAETEAEEETTTTTEEEEENSPIETETEEEEETTTTTEEGTEVETENSPIETEEETTTTTEEEEDNNEIEVVKQELEDLKSELEAIRDKLDELANTPAAAAIVDEFSKIELNDTKMGKKLNSALRYAQSLKK